MKRFLSVSLMAVLAVSPMVASATDTCPGAPSDDCTANVETNGPGANGYSLSTSATNDGTNVVTASYVKGAYNDLTRKINKVATDAASGITAAAGNGLTASGTTLNVDLATDSGLVLTGSSGEQKLGANVDGTTITKGTGGVLQVGTIANANIAANAGIAQSKIENLTTDLGNKQAKFTNGAQTDNTINTTVVTTIAASTSASDQNLATEKAIATAIETATSGLSGKQAQLVNSANPAENVSNVVQTSVRASGSALDTALATEKAVRDAVDGVASQQMTLTNKTIVASANSISGIATTNMDSGAIATSISANPVDTKLASEKAVSDALALKQNSLTNGAASGGEISSTVKTSVATTNASDNDLVTEKAVRDAIDAATTTAGMVTLTGTQTLTGKTISASNNTINDLGTGNFASGTVQTSVRVAASASDTALASEKAVRTALDNQRINILATWGSDTVTQTTIAPTPTQP